MTASLVHEYAKRKWAGGNSASSRSRRRNWRESWACPAIFSTHQSHPASQATQNDSCQASIEGLLRRTSPDKRLQFVNVLQGGMSIAGPCTHAVADNEEYCTLIKVYTLQHKVKLGITGWNQINGWRGETDTLEKMEKRIKYDLQYIRN